MVELITVLININFLILLTVSWLYKEMPLFENIFTELSPPSIVWLSVSSIYCQNDLEKNHLFKGKDRSRERKKRGMRERKNDRCQ